jgi:hypothetical protein
VFNPAWKPPTPTLVLGTSYRAAQNQPTATLLRGTFNSVAVSRYGPTAGFPPRPPERSVTVTDKTAIARLVSDANSLPVIPKGVIACGFDDGSYYEVRSSSAAGNAPTLHVGTTGCLGVSFADRPNRFVAWSLTDRNLLDDLAALFR